MYSKGHYQLGCQKKQRHYSWKYSCSSQAVELRDFLLPDCAVMLSFSGPIFRGSTRHATRQLPKTVHKPKNRGKVSYRSWWMESLWSTFGELAGLCRQRRLEPGITVFMDTPTCQEPWLGVWPRPHSESDDSACGHAHISRAMTRRVATPTCQERWLVCRLANRPNVLHVNIDASFLVEIENNTETGTWTKSVVRKLMHHHRMIFTNCVTESCTTVAVENQEAHNFLNAQREFTAAQVQVEVQSLSFM